MRKALAIPLTIGAFALPGLAHAADAPTTQELKQIVARLESGEGRLDEAIEAYERGACLKAHCEAKLREAQAKIERIGLGPDGSPRREPVDGNAAPRCLTL